MLRHKRACVGLMLMSLGASQCKQEPAKTPERQQVTRQGDDGNGESSGQDEAGEPVKAPPPGYGNKVVESEPREDASKHLDTAKQDEAETLDAACDDAEADEKECSKATAF